MEQHIEFGDGSAASAALAEAFDYFQRIAEDFDPSEIRAAVVVASGPGWGSALAQAPPVSRGQRRMWRLRPIQRTVKAGVG